MRGSLCDFFTTFCNLDNENSTFFGLNVVNQNNKIAGKKYEIKVGIMARSLVIANYSQMYKN